MRDIKRCPACLTYVYSDARRCHGCGERIGRRRILTRGSWIFIVLAATGFAIGRGIDLQQDKRDRIRREFEEIERTDKVKAFLNTWLTGDSSSWSGMITSSNDFVPALERLRNRYPDVLPATNVDTTISVRPRDDHRHLKLDDGDIKHEEEEWSSKLRASTAPRNTTYVAVSRSPRGRTKGHTWMADSYEFETRFKKGDAAFSIDGSVCIAQGGICCLAIHQIKGIEGKIEPARD